MTLQRAPNRPIFIPLCIVRLCYIIWLWIKPGTIIPSHATNYTKKYILNISKFLVISSSILLSLGLHLTWTRHELVPTPIIFVIDQSRSMAHNDLTPSRRDAALNIINMTYSVEKSDTPYNGLSRGDINTTVITYAQSPSIHKVQELDTLKPITGQRGSSALGDAWLITYDQIGSGLNHKPIVITITDGGSNTGYDLSQTASILKTRAQLWIVGLSTGTQIVAYDDEGRGLTSTMDTALLNTLADSGHRYPIPDDTSVDGVINTLGSDLSNQYYRLPPSAFSLQLILWVMLGLGILGRSRIYLSKNKSLSQ